MKLLKHYAAALLDSNAAQPLLRLLESRRDSRPDTLHVLTYHRIGHPDDFPGMDAALFSATTGAFRRQMEFVFDHYRPVSIADVIAAVREHKPLPPRAVLVTFDDAYCDFEQNAWPVLRDLGIPAALFVPTAYPDAPQREFWWDRISRVAMSAAPEKVLEGPWGKMRLTSRQDRLAALRHVKDFLKSLPHAECMQWVERLCADEPGVETGRGSVLSWSQLRRLSDQGVAIGLHTRSHPLLNRLEPESTTQEIADAWEDLKAQVPNAFPVFAYPGGAVSHAAVTQLKDCGIALAFTTRAGVNRVGSADPLLLRRTNVGWRATHNILRARLAIGL